MRVLFHRSGEVNVVCINCAYYLPPYNKLSNYGGLVMETVDNRVFLFPMDESSSEIYAEALLRQGNAYVNDIQPVEIKM